MAANLPVKPVTPKRIKSCFLEFIGVTSITFSSAPCVSSENAEVLVDGPRITTKIRLTVTASMVNGSKQVNQNGRPKNAEAKNARGPRTSGFFLSIFFI